MTKNELIQRLQQIDGNPRVMVRAVYDDTEHDEYYEVKDAGVLGPVEFRDCGDGSTGGNLGQRRGGEAAVFLFIYGPEVE